MSLRANRPSRGLRFGPPEALESRESTSIVGITEVANYAKDAPAKAGVESVLISGVVTADRPIGPAADALLFDASTPDTPTVLPVTLRALGGDDYAFALPLTLATKSFGRAGHGYAVAITVQGPDGPASTSTSFTLGSPPIAPKPAGHPGHPHPSGQAHRA